MTGQHKKRTINPVLPVLVLTMVILIAKPVTGSEADSLLAEGRRIFYQAVEKQEKIDSSLQVFHKIEKSFPEQAGVALTYIGATYALKGKHAFFPQRKFRFVNEGIEMMENGLRKSPENIEALFIYGMTCFHLPFFFKQQENAMDTFNRIITLLEENYRRYDSGVVLNVIDFMENEIDLTTQESQTLAEIKVALDQS